MRFNTSVSFNTHDSKLITDDSERIVIDRKRGVKTRCELCVNALIRIPEGMTAIQMAEYLNNRLKANYNSNDIRHALNRLVEHDVIRRNGEVYRANKSTYKSWKMARHNP